MVIVLIEQEELIKSTGDRFVDFLVYWWSWYY